MLDIRLLRALITLDDEKSVTSAAKRLGISQPAMSTTLRRLRDVFGDPLFVRSSKGLISTESAGEILDRARQITNLVDSLEQEKYLFNPETDDLELNISASDFALSNILPTLMRNLQRDAPHARISVTPLVLNTVAKSLENGSLDFAILPDFLAPEALQTRKLYEVELVYIMRDGHPLLQKPVTLESLSFCEHLRVAPTSTHHSNRVGKIFSDAGTVRNVRLTVTNYISAFDVIRDTDLIMLAPHNLVQQLGAGYSACKPPFELNSIVMSLIWHPRKQSSKSHIWARDYLVETVKAVMKNR